MRIPRSTALLLVSALMSKAYSSSLLAWRNSVVPVASDLQQQVPTIQMVQKFVPNILPDPVFPSVAGDFEFNKRDVEDGNLAVRAPPRQQVMGIDLDCSR